MFATEELMLKYFYDECKPFNINERVQKFDNSTFEEILEIATALEKKNQIIWCGSAQWEITDIGVAYYKSKLPKFNYERWSFVIAVALGTAILLAGFIISNI